MGTLLNRRNELGQGPWGVGWEGWVRQDYRVLSKGPLDGSWDLAALRESYLDGGFEGLNLRFMSPPPFPSLDFLADYDDLRYLEINTGRLNGDLPAFRLPALEELILLTRSSRAIPGFASPALARLGFDDRPGKELIAGLDRLRDLLIWRWRGPDLGFLGDKPPPLRVLRLDGTGRQEVSLAGIENCANLAELQVGESRVCSLAPLAGLQDLQELRILPRYRAAGESVLDLDDLLGLKNLRQLHLIYVGAVRSLRPLLQMPALRDLCLGPVDVADGDLSPLYDLPDSVELAGPIAERVSRHRE